MAAAPAGDAQTPRRSSRVKHSKNSDQKQFKVSSSMTLHALKMKVRRYNFVIVAVCVKLKYMFTGDLEG